MGRRVIVENLWEGYRAETSQGLRRKGEVHWALRDVSFSVASGEMLGVIGRNGSGKTTLLQSVAGVLLPTRGRVETTGRVSALVDLAAGSNRELTGRENVLLGGILLGLTRKEIRARYGAIAAFSELPEEALESAIRTYSAGMGLRLGFSLIVHADPSVLLVDEVLSAADDEFQRKALSKIDALRGDGVAVVVASHDHRLIAERCDRVLVLRDGEVQFLGHPSEAMDLSAHVQPAASPASGL